MFVISQTAVYALRAMAHLASADGRTVPSAELADAVGIPPHYVSKVMRRMVVADLCRAQRGHRGGFVLANEAEAIRFIDVIEAADPDQIPVGCAFGYGECDPECPCPLHDAWSVLKRSFAEWADRSLLSDVRDYAARPEVRRRPAARR